LTDHGTVPTQAPVELVHAQPAGREMLAQQDGQPVTVGVPDADAGRH
jgi:hypothetical protein